MRNFRFTGSLRLVTLYQKKQSSNKEGAKIYLHLSESDASANSLNLIPPASAVQQISRTPPAAAVVLSPLVFLPQYR